MILDLITNVLKEAHDRKLFSEGETKGRLETIADAAARATAQVQLAIKAAADADAKPIDPDVFDPDDPDNPKGEA